jgi:hypothetical protein
MVFASQSPYSGWQNVIYSRNVRRNVDKIDREYYKEKREAITKNIRKIKNEKGVLESLSPIQAWVIVQANGKQLAAIGRRTAARGLDGTRVSSYIKRYVQCPLTYL